MLPAKNLESASKFQLIFSAGINTTGKSRPEVFRAVNLLSVKTAF